ncbi:capsular polysaccharide biosynthesis protein [Rhodobacteraceae bacterium]|nr:capsular polysaccharide biosynthesis protein [Paracoccaceae bacterium]
MDKAAGSRRRLFYFNAGFARQKRLRQILDAAGYDLCLGLPLAEDRIAVWGRTRYATRGERAARHTGAGLVRVEDAFLRSVLPGRMGDKGPLGLLIDPYGVHFDASCPSLIEHLAQTHPLDDPALLERARSAIARLRAMQLSKYNNFDPERPAPPPGYVLVIDQTEGDASIRYGHAGPESFAQMLRKARRDHPDARIIIKTHPETRAGKRRGHFGLSDCDARTSLLNEPISPWRLLAGAHAVYTVSSLMGFEAILAGHTPHVFGLPFYAGWGVSHDMQSIARRTRTLTPAQLFAVSHILAPVWFDPCRKQRCTLEDALNHLEAECRSYREDRHGYLMTGMSRWKRPHLRRIFGRYGQVRFGTPDRLPTSSAPPIVHWASKPARPDGAARMEDGFLRSNGLGAQLVPPLSLICDTRGIYYDPNDPSDLEELVARPLDRAQKTRINSLLDNVIAARLSKYNLHAPAENLPEGVRVLVPGQVEDDASIRCGMGGRGGRNLDLLRVARERNPKAVVVYKPHPDVEAGLRPGAIAQHEARRYADVICHNSDPVALIEACDRVVTMTSLLGFEALIRGKPVTCLGMPFYAGWGLTEDLHPAPARRTARPDILQLAYATLIAYPRYFDPLSNLACPPEVAVIRLRDGLPARWRTRVFAGAQSRLVRFSHLWR